MTIDFDDVAAWQYHLPDELIASRPACRRDEARLMVVDRRTQNIRHHDIRDLPHLLRPGDRLVFNDTRVLPARLFGYRTETGGRWEGLFLDQPTPGLWQVTGQTRGRLRPGETLTVHPPHENSERLILTLQEQLDDGSWLMKPDIPGPAVSILETFGTLPLPPYIGRAVADEEDQKRYQTIFAARPGAIAAPTAGLHFTKQLLKCLSARHIRQSRVTLHVGVGTFRPVTAARLSDHVMHAEWCQVDAATAADITATKDSGSQIVAVGTTTVRTLETAARDGCLQPFSGVTDLFIRPGFSFQITDRLLTNFHLPGSTLIVLVAALAGYELIMEAYRVAVAERYRFYSYGDAMLII